MGGVSMEWKEVRLGDVCSRVCSGGTPKSTNLSYYGGEIPWLNTKEIDFNRIYSTEKTITDSGLNNSSAKWIAPNTVTVAMYGATAGKSCIVKVPMTTNQACCNLTINDEVADYEFVYYSLKNDYTTLASLANGGAQQNLNAQIIKDYVLQMPSLKDQRRIASILSSLDRKIELNNKINADLEEMAQAIFKNWFVDFEPFKDGKFVDSELGMIPEGWKVGRLTEIASYMNGLAMQKFPPENNEDSLPVLKIKELGQGFCGTDSDRCSCNIKDECKIHNGDVIFSWSGTLLVDVWCGGDCGLNQHLFKVTSKDYPKWFYYYWTKHHLQEFIHIAKDKAVTMGHIKRGHLEEALVAIPDNDSMERAHELFEPILSKMISLRLENSRLSLLRDTLLTRLMSGELEVPE